MGEASSSTFSKEVGGTEFSLVSEQEEGALTSTVSEEQRRTASSSLSEEGGGALTWAVSEEVGGALSALVSEQGGDWTWILSEEGLFEETESISQTDPNLISEQEHLCCWKVTYLIMEKYKKYYYLHI